MVERVEVPIPSLTFSPGRLRLLAFLRWTMLAAGLLVLVFPLWTVYREWSDRAVAPRFSGTITEIVTDRSPGTRLPIHDYGLRVRYGPNERTELRTMSYRHYRAGDRVGLLRNPRTGRLEVDPFPEWWVTGGLLSAFSVVPFLLFVLSGAVLRGQRGRLP